MTANDRQPDSVLRGAVLTVAMRWTDRLIGVASTLILARLLVPDDFGVIAMASLVVGFIDILFDVGVNVALIQNTHATPAHYHTAWTLRLMQAAVATLLIVAVAPLAAEYFNDPRVTPVLWVTSSGVLLAALENIWIIDFQKKMHFAQDFRFVFAKRLAGFVVTIAAALVLRSYWALVIGSLAGRAVGVGLSYAMHPSRPRLSLEKFSDIFSVSQWMFLRSIANYLNTNMHQFLVGGRATSAMVGGYSLAQQISSMPSTEVLAPLNRVLFPAFVKAKHNAQELKRVYLLAQGVQTLVVMPFSIGLAMLATETVYLMLGEKWLFVAPFVQVLALSAIAQSISVSGSYVLLTLGEFARQTLLTGAQVVVFLLGAFLLIPQGGAMEIAILRLATILLGLAASVWLLLHKMDGVRLADILRSVRRPLLASLAMSLAIHALALQLHTGMLASLLLKGALGAAVYLLVVAALWRLAGRPPGSEAYLLDKLQQWRGARKK